MALFHVDMSILREKPFLRTTFCSVAAQVCKINGKKVNVVPWFMYASIVLCLSYKQLVSVISYSSHLPKVTSLLF